MTTICLRVAAFLPLHRLQSHENDTTKMNAAAESAHIFDHLGGGAAKATAMPTGIHQRRKFVFAVSATVG
jgi:hypothetical protein